ncbi:hypothetical protein ABK040_008695 [Willaertia magna]
MFQRPHTHTGSTRVPLSTMNSNVLAQNQQQQQSSTQKFNRPVKRHATPTIPSSKQNNNNNNNTPKLIEERYYKKNEKGERQVVSRKYQQERFLGKGGFAQCYAFRQISNNRIYAAKIIDKQSLQKENVKQKLYSEIKIHSSLSHRHIVRFVRYFEDNSNVYILLELCNCGSMMDLLKTKTRLTEQEARFFLHQLLLALVYMNERRVIHRDLKLGNLFLTDKMEIKIGDFGLATQVEFEGERKKTICGTPNYIAPEILYCKSGHSFEVDVWSVGVILYTMLVGTPPFETKDVKETYKKIKSNEYSFPEHVQVSSRAKALVKKILRRNPTDRPTIGDILNDPFFTNFVPDYCPITLDEYVKTHTLPYDNSEEGLPAAYSSKHPDYQNQMQKLKQQQEQRVPFKMIENTVHQRTNLPITTTTTTNTAVDTLRNTKIVHNENLNPLPTSNTVPKVKPTIRQQQQMIIDDSPQTELPNQHVFTSPNELLTKPKLTRTATITRSPTPKRKPTEEIRSTPHSAPSEQLETSRATKGPPVKKSRTPATCNVASPASGPFVSPTVTVSPTNGFDPMFVDDEDNGPITGPSTWITCWADFSQKYGLAYLMNNGCVGALYNDSSKMIYNPSNEEIHYFEKKQTESGNYDEKTSFSAINFPPSMNKKVTLIKYFKTYMDKLKDNEVQANSDSGKSSYREDKPIIISFTGFYVKRWLKTKHAIIFRLNNKMVQVCFFDKTEIILNGENNLVTYTDAEGKRTTHPLNKIVKYPTPDISKRLKYTKEVLYQLISPTNNTPQNK